MSELTKELETKAMTALDDAKSRQIQNQGEYEAAAEFVKSVKVLKKKISDHYADPIAKAYAAHKAIKAAEQELLKPLDEAEKLVKGKCNTYLAEQERIRQAEERRLQEEARKKAEEKAAKEQKAAEFLADITGETAPPPEPVVVPEIKIEAPPKVDGTYSVEVWKYEITDPKLIPDEYKIIDEKKIGGVVRALKGLTNIPGLRVWSEKDIRIRT